MVQQLNSSSTATPATSAPGLNGLTPATCAPGLGVPCCVMAVEGKERLLWEAELTALRHEVAAMRAELSGESPGMPRESAHSCHICTGTGPTPPTSAPGLGSPLQHLHRDFTCRPNPHTAADLAATRSAVARPGRSFCACARPPWFGRGLPRCGRDHLEVVPDSGTAAGSAHISLQPLARR